jgi:hypothetical protein
MVVGICFFGRNALARTKEAKEARRLELYESEKALKIDIREKAKTIAKRAIGRPSTFNADTWSRIVTRMAHGESLTSITRDDDMPGISTVYQWAAARPEIAEGLARARESLADTLLDECADIADNVPFCEDDDARNSFEIQRAKLKIETRLRAIAHMSPRKYGTHRTEVTGANGGPIALASVTIDARQLAPEQRETLRAALLATKNNNNINTIEHDPNKPDED